MGMVFGDTANKPPTRVHVLVSDKSAGILIAGILVVNVNRVRIASDSVAMLGYGTSAGVGVNMLVNSASTVYYRAVGRHTRISVPSSIYIYVTGIAVSSVHKTVNGI